MAVADPGSPSPDLYQLLGVPRQAPRQAIAQAWRRRARSEHPDSRPGDAAAPARFQALASAWHVLGDPARRAAYDQALACEQIARPASMPGPPPLRAGPVRVEGPPRAAAPGQAGAEQIRLAALAALGIRYLAWDLDRDWSRPW